MGVWDRIRSWFSPSKELTLEELGLELEREVWPPELHQHLAREWKFVDDSEWSERLASGDPAVLAIYADWLEEQGDARHELVCLAAFPGRFPAFITANAEALFGPLAARLKTPGLRPELGLTWDHGVLRGVSCRSEQVWPDALELLRRPITRTVTSFAAGAFFDPPPPDLPAQFFSEHGHRFRELFLGDFVYPDECEMSWAQNGEIAVIWKLVPNLARLKLRGGVAGLGDIDAPHLTHFTFETSGLTRAELDSVARARWPKLEHLELWFGDANYGAEYGPEDVTKFLATRPPPGLTSFGLCNFEFSDLVLDALLTSPWTSQVKRLDLSKGCLSDEGVRTLLLHRDRLAHLDSLDLSQNLLSDTHLEALRGLCREVKLDDQRLDEMDEDLRYVAVTE
ncbi:MAG: hypothetical protein U0228_26090 [Myxococcaceae bacterium]